MIVDVPEIAIVESNTLMTLGLRSLLEELIPEATVRCFPNFEGLIDDTPDVYCHYFVSANIYFDHIEFFRARKYKAIVLSAGEQPTLKGVPCLNVCLPQKELLKTFIALRENGHQRTHHPVKPIAEDDEHELSPREIEVIRLVSQGYINKEIADKLSISITTVISHRKNITEKLNIKSVSGLTIYAIMHGYIKVDEIQ